MGRLRLRAVLQLKPPALPQASQSQTFCLQSQKMVPCLGQHAMSLHQKYMLRRKSSSRLAFC